MRSIPPKPVVGDKYGFLAILDEGKVQKSFSAAGRRRYTRLVLVRCDCGTEKRINWHKVRRGTTTSCGCYQRDCTSKRSFKHGDCYSAIYTRWAGLFKRCENESDASYKNYGARGITICDEWRDFTVFREWAFANGFSPELQLDRINNSGPYSPGNCRWVDAFVNARNKRNNYNITAFGETKCLQEWARDSRCSITDGGIRVRLKAGWSPEDAISLPSSPGKPIKLLQAFGEEKMQLDWSRDPRCKVTQVGLSWRLRHGWAIEDAITTPPTPPKEKNPTGKGAIRRVARVNQ